MYINDINNDLISDSIAADASNIRSGENPAYTLSDFLSVYPGFGSYSGQTPTFTGVVPEAVLEMFTDLANTCIQQARFHGAWEICMGYFIAHFATLWLEGNANAGSSAAAVLAAGQAKGLVASKGANDLSVSYDFSTIAKDLDGWAAWTMTNHGRNLASLAKLYGKGGMVVR
jgi:hypothetical protein